MGYPLLQQAATRGNRFLAHWTQHSTGYGNEKNDEGGDWKSSIWGCSADPEDWDQADIA